MESAGKYWIPVFNIQETSCQIVLAHQKYVKAIRGKKTDKKDTKWIADIFMHDLISFPAALSRPSIFANFGIWCVTGGNSPTSQPEEESGA